MNINQEENKNWTKDKIELQHIQSMKSIIDDNRYQSISVNRLILIIDNQSMKQIFVTFCWLPLISNSNR